MSRTSLNFLKLHQFILGAVLAILSSTSHPQSAALPSNQIDPKDSGQSPGNSLVTTPVCPRPIRIALFDIEPLFDPEHDKGIDKDVIVALQKKTHCRFVFVFESRIRIWKMLESGTLDMTVSGISNSQRNEFADFVPYYRARNVLIMSETARIPASPNVFLANNELKLGVVKSYVHGPGWDEWIAKLRQSDRVVEIADTRDLFRQLDAGHVQAIPVLQPVAVALGERYPTSHSLVQLHWFIDQPDVEYCLVLSKKLVSPELHKYIAEKINEMRTDGTLKNIFRRYLNEEDANAMALP